jgi:predicted esterase
MTRTFGWALLASACSFGLGAVACSDGAVVRDQPHYPGADGGAGSPDDGPGSGLGEGGAPGTPPGAPVGADCSASEPCRAGLSCTRGACEPAGNLAAGDACVIGAECDTGQCVARQCVSAGEGTAGTDCSSDQDCSRGLRCAAVGLSLSCTPEGDGDAGAACATSLDCFAGLGCFDAKCGVPANGLPALGAPWKGVACEKPVTKDVQAYFEVPGADGASEGDFFRLPFPSDVRKHGNKLDLSGFPTPGAGLLGVDTVQLYVDAITENDSAWGAYPTVFFRFSGALDFDTFPAGAVQFFDVTDATKARRLGWQRFYTDGRTNYVCDNFLAVQPPVGAPLEPGHTYAVFVLSESEDDAGQAVTLLGSGDGQPVVASENFAAMLASDAAGDQQLRDAHAAFAPFRDFLAAYVDAEASPIAAENVLTAAVFTVGELRRNMAQVAAAVAQAPLPTASHWVKCGGAAVSPCPQAEDDRACSDVDGYDEYQALLSIPVFQRGTPPYLTPADGGALDLDAPHFEDVCLSITVPETAPPENGWPAVVFAHGTGGSFRSHVRDEVAGVLAAATPQFAVIGIDQVEHGPRRGNSTESPDNLFFNFSNPAATRGNPLQGAADQLSVARFAKALDIDAATSNGEALKLDPERLFFFGHSQGSTEGSLMLPFGDDYRAAVLSGDGASLRDALRTKTKPKNIAAALPIVLQERPNASDPDYMAWHPVLSLLQQWIDPADPLNFAAVLGKPLAEHQAKHIFQTFGVADSYSPPKTLETFALAAHLTQVKPHSSAKPAYLGSLSQDDIVGVGLQAQVGAFTLGMRQYGAPASSDGHFVVFDTPAANDDMVLFFTGAAGSTPPRIGQ